jgi:protocatechuate 3,4-dioxygenase beta subunit
MQHDHHSPELQRDLLNIERMRQRRQMLTWLASGGAAAFLASCGGSDDSSSTSSSSSSSGSSSSTSGSTSGSSSSTSCIVDPTETNGPYPSDGSNSANGSVSNILTSSGIVRSDIRNSFGSSTTTAPGLPVTLTITLVNSNMSCEPLQAYAIYMWHCDSGGNYSIYSSGLSNENYLRGVQVTDANGQATFTTVFPGCYSGRYPHMHFEIYPGLASATSYKNSVLISQMAMPSDICTEVYKSVSGYSQSVTNFSQVTVSSDNVFGDNTAAQIAQQTPSLSGDTTNGFTGTILIGVAV